MHFFLILFTSFFINNFFIETEKTADLTINIANIKEIKGHFQIGVYTNFDNLPSPDIDDQYRTLYHKAEIPITSITIQDLPIGEYFLAIYQDEDQDGILNSNFINVPQEPFCFSNNVHPLKQFPSFKNGKIILNEDTKIDLSLIHLRF